MTDRDKCLHGHDLTNPENYFIRTVRGRSRKDCVICRRAHGRKYYERRQSGERKKNAGPTQTKCVRDHDLTNPDNVYVDPGGRWKCKLCQKLHSQKQNIKAYESRTHCSEGHEFPDDVAFDAIGRRRCLICARPTHCKRNHTYTPQNTKVEANGHRRCLTCARLADRMKRRWQKGHASFDAAPLIPFIRRAARSGIMTGDDNDTGVTTLSRLIAEYSLRRVGKGNDSDYQVTDWTSEQRNLIRILHGHTKRIDDRTADKICTALGLHPIHVWGWDAYMGSIAYFDEHIAARAAYKEARREREQMERAS